jgi:PAS domain S-box-containing protein
MRLLVIYTNQAVLDIFGYRTVEELKKMLGEQLYTPESLAERRERIKKRQRGEFVPPEYEISIRRPDGQVRNLQVFRREVIWGGERQFMAMYLDITERKRAEEKHRTILKTTPDGFWTVDLKGKIIEVNESYCNMLGYTQEELLGMTIRDVEALDTSEEILRAYKKNCRARLRPF